MVTQINDKMFQSLAVGHWNAEQVILLEGILAYCKQLKSFVLMFKTLGINVNDEVTQLEYAEQNLQKVVDESRAKLELSALRNDLGT